MPIYVYQGNKQISTNAIRNNKVVRAIYAKEQGQEAVCVWGYDVADSLFTYTVQNDLVTITGLNSNIQFSGNLSIPNTIKGKQVKNIGSYAFKDCTGLTNITIPSSVTDIGGYAFQGCTGLTRITIPDSVTSIGGSAFSGCSSLESITIPFVGSDVVSATEGSYIYPIGYIFGTSSYDGGVATEQYKGILESSQGLLSTTYYIPSSLRSVTVTGGNILVRAFYNCSSLTNITIPDSVTSIDNEAFYGCASLTSVIIPNSVTDIGYQAFRGCTGLTSIYYTGDIAGWCGIIGLGNLMSYGLSSKTLYIGGNKVEELIIPDSVTSISGSAFYGCAGLTSITIPNSVTDIGYNAFRDCTGLTSVTIPNRLTRINNNVFYNCTGLTSITIGNGVTIISDSVFGNCTRLTSVTIPDSVTGIGTAAFENCTGLMSATIGKGVKSIGSNVFRGCSNLTSITFNGTKAQWNAIKKGTDWNSNTGNYTIHCTDGDIPK